MKWKLNCLEATGVLNYIVNIFIIPQEKKGIVDRRQLHH